MSARRSPARAGTSSPRSGRTGRPAGYKWCAAVEGGRIDFDNNLTENAVRPTKLGMKNWMFIGGEGTGWRSAVIYTMVEQVRRHGRDPSRYFKWVFGKLPAMTNQDDFAPPLPSASAAALEVAGVEATAAGDVAA